MAAYDGHVILDTRVDTTGINKGFTQIKSAGKSIIASMGKIGSAIGIAFGVSALVKFGKEAVELASDVEEVQNVVNVAFGDMAYKMEQFANTAIETYGISKLTAKQTASTYMAMAKGMGIASDTASDMALSLTGLSADMASFYNISQDVADVALKSVFTGETETLKKYGIVMTQTNLQEYARQKGITKSISAMTQQEQVMLRYQYVMQQTALAQGDFVRTQDSWANQTRILSERWKEMQIQWGEAFKTIGTLVLPAVNTLISGLTKVAEIAAQATKQVAKLFGYEIDTTSDVTDNISESVDNQNDLTEAVKETNKATKGLLNSYDEVNQITREDTSETGGLGTSLSGSILQQQELQAKSEETTFKLSNNFNKIVEAAKETGLNLKEEFKKWKPDILDPTTEIFETFWNDTEDIFSNGMLSIIQTLGSEEFKQVLEELRILLSIALSAIKNAMSSLKKFLQNLMDYFTNSFQNMTLRLAGIFNIITGILSGDGKKVVLGLKQFGVSILNGLIDTFNFFIGSILSSIEGIINLLGGAAEKIGSLSGKKWGWHVDFSALQIPRVPVPALARGAVIPANKPFLAQLGDQKNGRNLEAPESLLRDIYAEGNAETNALLQQLIQVMQKGMTVNVDGKQLMRINREAETRVGRQTVTGGFANAY